MSVKALERARHELKRKLRDHVWFQVICCASAFCKKRRAMQIVPLRGQVPAQILPSAFVIPSAWKVLWASCNQFYVKLEAFCAKTSSRMPSNSQGLWIRIGFLLSKNSPSLSFRAICEKIPEAPVCNLRFPFPFHACTLKMILYSDASKKSLPRVAFSKRRLSIRSRYGSQENPFVAIKLNLGPAAQQGTSLLPQH